jgi:murein DD-endopeptidase MepM/ murein hydrolase activator NlpD
MPNPVFKMISSALWILATALSGGQNQIAYLLPYPPGVKNLLIQGNNGPWGHTDKIAFAYDFKMPIGSPVCAARDGIVTKTEDRYEDGNRTPGQENYIFVSHGDGTFSRYYHLTQHGVLIKVGDHIKAGDRIGKSGNTGASAGPHLHFDVTEKCPEWGCQTIPIRFKNVAENPLQQGKEYEALAAK